MKLKSLYIYLHDRLINKKKTMLKCSNEKFNTFDEDNCNSNLIKVDNSYINKITRKKIIWVNYKEKFIKINEPNFILYGHKIKKDILEKALKLEKNSCIIDCGAHIGDGSIPIAHALRFFGREDIIVYAIEPSEDKCNFIKFIAKKIN